MMEISIPQNISSKLQKQSPLRATFILGKLEITRIYIRDEILNRILNGEPENIPTVKRMNFNLYVASTLFYGLVLVYRKKVQIILNELSSGFLTKHDILIDLKKVLVVPCNRPQRTSRNPNPQYSEIGVARKWRTKPKKRTSKTKSKPSKVSVQVEGNESQEEQREVQNIVPECSLGQRSVKESEGARARLTTEYPEGIRENEQYLLQDENIQQFQTDPYSQLSVAPDLEFGSMNIDDLLEIYERDYQEGVKMQDVARKQGAYKERFPQQLTQETQQFESTSAQAFALHENQELLLASGQKDVQYDEWYQPTTSRELTHENEQFAPVHTPYYEQYPATTSDAFTHENVQFPFPSAQVPVENNEQLQSTGIFEPIAVFELPENMDDDDLQLNRLIRDQEVTKLDRRNIKKKKPWIDESTRIPISQLKRNIKTSHTTLRVKQPSFERFDVKLKEERTKTLLSRLPRMPLAECLQHLIRNHYRVTQWEDFPLRPSNDQTGTTILRDGRLHTAESGRLTMNTFEMPGPSTSGHQTLADEIQVPLDTSLQVTDSSIIRRLPPVYHFRQPESGEHELTSRISEMPSLVPMVPLGLPHEETHIPLPELSYSEGASSGPLKTSFRNEEMFQVVKGKVDRFLKLNRSFLFESLCPPEETSREDAAQTFKILLDLHAGRKILLSQLTYDANARKNAFAPIYIRKY